jgi:sugar lactone lactonase YvrE
VDSCVRRLADGFSFLESPRWHDGALYLSDFYTHRVILADQRGRYRTICEVPGQPSGLGFDRENRLLIVSMTDRKLLRLEGPRLHEVADLAGLAPYHCNDMVVDDQGRAYIGNFGSDVDVEGLRPTCVILVGPDGSARVAADGLIFPNGLAITPDGQTLLVAETFAHRITAFSRAADGSLRSGRTWASFGDPAGGPAGSLDSSPASTMAQVPGSGRVAPDGICLDAEGALWVADALGTGALRVSPTGATLAYVDTSPDAVYAVALGGDDGRTLFMCAAPPLGRSDPAREFRASLLSCTVDVPG